MSRLSTRKNILPKIGEDYHTESEADKGKAKTNKFQFPGVLRDVLSNLKTQ